MVIYTVSNETEWNALSLAASGDTIQLQNNITFTSKPIVITLGANTLDGQGYDLILSPDITTHIGFVDNLTGGTIANLNVDGGGTSNPDSNPKGVLIRHDGVTPSYGTFTNIRVFNFTFTYITSTFGNLSSASGSTFTRVGIDVTLGGLRSVGFAYAINNFTMTDCYFIGGFTSDSTEPCGLFYDFYLDANSYITGSYIRTDMSTINEAFSAICFELKFTSGDLLIDKSFVFNTERSIARSDVSIINDVSGGGGDVKVVNSYFDLGDSYSSASGLLGRNPSGSRIITVTNSYMVANTSATVANLNYTIASSDSYSNFAGTPSLDNKNNNLDDITNGSLPVSWSTSTWTGITGQTINRATLLTFQSSTWDGRHIDAGAETFLDYFVTGAGDPHIAPYYGGKYMLKIKDGEVVTLFDNNDPEDRVIIQGFCSVLNEKKYIGYLDRLHSKGKMTKYKKAKSILEDGVYFSTIRIKHNGKKTLIDAENLRVKTNDNQLISISRKEVSEIDLKGEPDEYGDTKVRRIEFPSVNVAVYRNRYDHVNRHSISLTRIKNPKRCTGALMKQTVFI